MPATVSGLNFRLGFQASPSSLAFQAAFEAIQGSRSFFSGGSGLELEGSERLNLETGSRPGLLEVDGRSILASAGLRLSLKGHRVDEMDRRRVCGLRGWSTLL